MRENGRRQTAQGITRNAAGGRLGWAAGRFLMQRLNVLSLLPLPPFLSCCFFHPQSTDRRCRTVKISDRQRFWKQGGQNTEEGSEYVEVRKQGEWGRKGTLAR